MAQLGVKRALIAQETAEKTMTSFDLTKPNANCTEIPPLDTT
jgi:hypothetical protein